MSEQMPFGSFGTDDFALNAEPRCACVLLLDVSISMRGDPITALNQGLVTFKDELVADSLSAKRVEVATVTFGPVQVVHDFVSADAYQPTSLQVQGDTPMGAAIMQGLELVRTRKETYRANAVPFYRPWIFLITDGAPTDAWQQAAAMIREGESSKAFAFFAVGVEGANMDTLAKLSSRTPLALDGLRFRDLFVWLSNSMKSVSRSTPGTEVPLDNPTVPGGWAAV